MPVTWLSLNPLDTLSVRDGRSFAAGSDTTSTAVFPPPSTVAGAVHKALEGIGRSGPSANRGRSGGRSEVPADRQTRFTRLAGPVVHRPGDGLLFPWPRHLVVSDDGTAQLLRVASGDGVVHDDDVPGLLVGDGEVPDGVLLRAGQLETVLHGALTADDLDDLDDLAGHGDRAGGVAYDTEVHVGLYRANGRTAEDKYLYAAQHLRFGQGVSLAVRVNTEVEVPDERRLVQLGGERRLVEVHKLARPIVPAMADRFDGGRLLLYLATPAVFEGGWRPDLPGGIEVKAAAVGAPLPISTRARGTHVLRWAVPAGSVYFLQATDERAASDFARSVHDRSVRQVEARLRTSGFGWCFTGRWS